MKPCKPRLKKLRTLLNSSSYKGSELENEILASNEVYTFKDLSSKIQASDEELKVALNDIGAFQINGIDILVLLKKKVIIIFYSNNLNFV